MLISEEKVDTLATDDTSPTFKTTSTSHKQTLLSKNISGDLVIEDSQTFTETADQTKKPKVVETPSDKVTSVRVAKSVGVSNLKHIY